MLSPSPCAKSFDYWVEPKGKGSTGHIVPRLPSHLTVGAPFPKVCVNVSPTVVHMQQAWPVCIGLPTLYLNIFILNR